MYEVNKDLWDSLTANLKQGRIALQVWPNQAAPGVKLSRVVNGERPLDPSDIGRLANAIGLPDDDDGVNVILDIFPYLKEGE
jgi:hypothetical protein